MIGMEFLLTPPVFQVGKSGFPFVFNELGGPVQISRDLVLTVKPDPDGEVIRAIGRIYLRGTLLNNISAPAGRTLLRCTISIHGSVA